MKHCIEICLEEMIVKTETLLWTLLTKDCSQWASHQQGQNTRDCYNKRRLSGKYFSHFLHFSKLDLTLSAPLWQVVFGQLLETVSFILRENVFWWKQECLVLCLFLQVNSNLGEIPSEIVFTCCKRALHYSCQ